MGAVGCSIEQLQPTTSAPLCFPPAVFRDDLVFLIYLYQRWIYRVDKSRANEYGYTEEQQEEEAGEEDNAPVVAATADQAAAGGGAAQPEETEEQEPKKDK